MEQQYWWEIEIHGYGTFAVYATESEAEDIRRHKANWEGAVGKKRIIDADIAAQMDQKNIIEFMNEKH